MTSTLIRCALAGLAIVVGAWLVLGYRSAGLEADAVTLIERVQDGNAGPREVDRAKDFLRRARTLSADTTPLVKESDLLLSARRDREALGVAERAAAEEPENIDAWFRVFLTAKALEDSRRAREARRRVRALNPFAGQALGARG